MKKFNGKLIASVLMAGIMATAASVSAGAAFDYGEGDDPSSYAPVIKTTAKVDGVTADAPVPVVTPTIVTEAIDNAKDGVATVYATESKNGKITVTEETMAKIANGDVVVEIVVESSTGLDYTVTIDPKTITNAKAINVAMKIEVTTKGTTINSVEVPAGSIIIYTGMKYEYGCTLKVFINKNQLKDVATGDAKLYSISADGEVADDITESLTIGSDGSATIVVSHGATLVITSEDLGGAEAAYEAAAVEEIGVEDAKSDNAPIVIAGDNDMNPGTGVSLALGALALSAAAVAVTKKRK